MKTRKEIVVTSSEVESVVEEIIRETIQEAKNITLHKGLFIFNSETRLLSHTLEVRENYGTISCMTYHEMVKLSYRSLLMTLQLPPIMSSGKQIDSYVLDLESLDRHARAANVPLPFDPLTEKGLKFLDRSVNSVYCSDLEARFTDPKRIVSCVNAFLKFISQDGLDQSTTNPMLMKIEAAYAQQAYHCEFISDDDLISEIYHNEAGASTTRYTSCMAGKSTSYFEMYDDLQQHKRLTLIHLMNGKGEWKGRALCWIGSNPDDFYLDRIYVPESNGYQIQDAVEAFRVFCSANNIRKSVFTKTADSIGLEHKSISIELPKELRYYDSYPYADSMYRVCSDGKLRNHSNYPSGVYLTTELHNTDGTIDNDEIVYLHDGTRCHIDNACYVERYSEYYNEDECVYTRAGDNELTRDCYELDRSYYDRNAWAYEDDCVETHDGEFILTDDAIELHDGAFAHTDEVTALEDGSNAYALSNDCEELSDGRWVLAADVAVFEAEIAANNASDDDSEELAAPPATITVTVEI